jgi:hypothetical protein
MSLLVGTDASGQTAQAAGYIFGCQFTAVATGTSVTFRVYSTSSGNIKVAIYSDNAGAPATRLWHNSTGAAVTGGQFNEISAAGVSITSGTAYWLMTNGDASGCSSRASSSGGQPRVRLSKTYSTWTWPETDEGGYTADNYTMMLYVDGTESGGWEHISKMNGVSSSSISKINGIAVASISKINGIEV